MPCFRIRRDINWTNIAQLGRVAALVLAALSLATPAAAQRTPLDYGLAVGSTALIVMDWGQTLDFATRGTGSAEANPFLGPHPSVGRVNTFASLGAALNLAAFALPKSHRRVWYEAVIAVETFVVLHGASQGYRIRF